MRKKKKNSSGVFEVPSQLMVFGFLVHLQWPFDPLYSNPNGVYYSRNFACKSEASVPGSRGGISRLPSRRPCAGLSGYCPCPLPSSRCGAEGGLGNAGETLAGLPSISKFRNLLADLSIPALIRHSIVGTRPRAPIQ
ncbi:hypothetical protein TIFTF001_052705 [Ficus carica]|uniref:Uncharacterized protein n=1 Tax=Ficus carica TaxID=3494 RepID=A0AA88EBB2_FICCA|nr:hypothetical protein TIFTF001_052705 [Ficus carica]